MFGSEALAERFGIRAIASDRPGVGLSTFQPNRRFSDWPADVSALADGLGLQRFAVLAHSGGAPYALACGRSGPSCPTLSSSPMKPSDWARGIAPITRPSSAIGRRGSWAASRTKPASSSRHGWGARLWRQRPVLSPEAGQTVALLGDPDHAVAGPRLDQPALGTKRAGFTLGEIRTLLHGFPTGTGAAERWQALASEKLVEVDEAISQLQETRTLLEEALRCECASLDECARLLYQT